MPIYEYQCRDCGSGFERLVRRFDEAVACPACARADVERQLSVFAVGVAAPAFAGCGAGACSPSPGGCDASACAGGACSLD